MMTLLTFAAARLREPSTYASLAVLLALAHVNVDPGALHTMSALGGVIAAVLGISLTEASAGKTPLKIASDAFAAFVAAVKALPSWAASAIAGPLAILALGFALCACSPAQITTALASPTGQLFCEIQTNGGGAFVAGLTATAASSAAPAAAPLFVIATGAGEAAVNDDCAKAAKSVPGGRSGVPVSPPATPVNVPQVAIVAPASPVVGGATKPTS
jgi:hypothetical protein